MQEGGEGLIPEGLYICENMSLWISLRRGSTTEVLNRGLYTLVIKANNRCRKRGGDRSGGEGLIIVVTYTQVENALGLHLR